MTQISWKFLNITKKGHPTLSKNVNFRVDDKKFEWNQAAEYYLQMLITHTSKTLNTYKRDEVLQPQDGGEEWERESTKLLCLYSHFPNWLIHFQELESMLGTKFLQKGAGSFRLVCWIGASKRASDQSSKSQEGSSETMFNGWRHSVTMTSQNIRHKLRSLVPSIFQLCRRVGLKLGSLGLEPTAITTKPPLLLSNCFNARWHIMNVYE